jgi:ferredoxin
VSDPAQPQTLTVTFSFTDESFEWTGEYPTILKLAQAKDIPISAGCEYGDCGTCLTDLISGEVEYLHQTGVEPEPGTCLPCSCRPKTSVDLRA